MKISDIIKFVKAGYTPQEIKDIEDPANVIALLDGGIKKDDISGYMDLLTVSDHDPEPEPEPEQDPEPEPEKDETDYKKLYTDLLKKQQEQNVNRDMSGNSKEKTNDEKLQDIVRKFM